MSQMAAAIVKKRRRAAHLLKQGLGAAEVARRVGVSRKTVSKWRQSLQTSPVSQRQTLRRFYDLRLGRPPTRNQLIVNRMLKYLSDFPINPGDPGDWWKRNVRMLTAITGRRYSRSGAWRFLKRAFPNERWWLARAGALALNSLAWGGVSAPQRRPEILPRRGVVNLLLRANQSKVIAERENSRSGPLPGIALHPR